MVKDSSFVRSLFVVVVPVSSVALPPLEIEDSYVMCEKLYINSKCVAFFLFGIKCTIQRRKQVLVTFFFNFYL